MKNPASVASALLAGLIFGLGLIISGMANPAKVQNFLDITGHWDPSLAFVMGGAIAVTLPGFAWLRRRERPLFESSFSWPTSSDITLPLVAGSALFGIGWGLGGYCPGPAITSVSAAASGTLVFVATMLAGFIIAKHLRRHLSS